MPLERRDELLRHLHAPRAAGHEAAACVAAKAGAPDTWLNDAVKAFLSPRGHFDDYLEL